MQIKGFSLIELLFTLSIIALVSLLGISATALFRDHNQKQLIISEIKTAVQFARIQAVLLGHPVYLSSLKHDSNWSNGMILFQRNEPSKQVQILSQWDWDYPQWNIEWVGINGLKTIRFSNNSIHAISNGTFLLMDLKTKECTKIVLNRLGRIKGSTYEKQLVPRSIIL